jgi:hypothetical protein
MENLWWKLTSPLPDFRQVIMFDQTSKAATSHAAGLFGTRLIISGTAA